ncbi:MAG TPA: cytochrome C oxidase subunit IV family protein [Acidobacteriota bacterium]|nr:cytochrome C oxidase subunit IV family protein [Acidobacteriota bacterium]
MSEHVVPLRIYYTVFAALLFLTGLTVFVAFFDLGTLNTIVALTIAVIKATLVVLFFMHVWYSSKLTWVFVGAGIFWFLILIAFLFGDVLTRDWLPTAVGWEGN